MIAERLFPVKKQITLLYANANMKVGIEVFCRIIAGFVWEGRVVANTWFVGLGYTTILDGLSFAQDMKLCLYYHVRTQPFRARRS